MDRRDRNDVAVNDILSQLSQDETVLEEVRKIALRGLKAQGANGDSQRTRSALQEVGRSKRDDVPEQSSGSNATNQRQNNTSHKTTSTAKNEELAFTISKESDTYRNIFSTVQWYRDSFLIGSTFADQKSTERKVMHSGQDEKTHSSGEKFLTADQTMNQNDIPKSDPSTAMGHPLLLSVAENYVRSISAIDLLRPYATWVVSQDGPMLLTATHSMAQSIPFAQSSCDWAMRENALWVLKDEEWKEFAKSITTTYVDRSYRDG